MESIEKDNESYIYVSYSDSDEQSVIEIVNDLRAAGHSVYFDREARGDSEAEARAISGASAVIACISEAYISSSQCRKELTYLQDKNKNMVTVYIDRVKLSDGMAMQLMLNQAIYKSKYTTRDSFNEALLSAPMIKRLLDSKAKKGSYKPQKEFVLKEDPFAVSLISNQIPKLVFFLYAIALPLVMHLTTKNYPGFGLFMLFTLLPSIVVSILGVITLRLSNAESFDAIIPALIIALIATPFFVHTVTSIILKILISLGINLLSALIIFIIVFLNTEV